MALVMFNPMDMTENLKDMRLPFQAQRDIIYQMIPLCLEELIYLIWVNNSLTGSSFPFPELHWYLNK